VRWSALERVFEAHPASAHEVDTDGLAGPNELDVACAHAERGELVVRKISEVNPNPTARFSFTRGNKRLNKATEEAGLLSFSRFGRVTKVESCRVHDHLIYWVIAHGGDRYFADRSDGKI
jgi:hypothetical protein